MLSDEIFQRCTSLKLYNCEDCGKTYTNSGHLARHQRVHTGVKPYLCEVCHRSFQRKEHLKRHLATHKQSEVTEIITSQSQDQGKHLFLSSFHVLLK